MNDTPVTVNASPVPGAVGTLIRQIVLLACGWAVAKGYFGQSFADQLIPIGVGALTLGYGQIKSWLLHTKLAGLAGLLPDSIAVTK